jgi:hypothetical protein
VFAPVAGVAGVTALAITVAQRRRGDDLLERSTAMSSSTNEARGLRQLLAALMVTAAALFMVGVAREHSLHHSEAKPATATEPTHTEGGDEGSHTAERTSPQSSTETHSESTTEGRVLGINIETWPIVIAFAALLLGLAIALVRSRSRTVVAVTALVAGVAAAFDIAEVAHQTKESQTSLVVIAIVVTALHVAALVLGAMILNAEAPRQIEGRQDPALAT